MKLSSRTDDRHTEDREVAATRMSDTTTDPKAGYARQHEEFGGFSKGSAFFGWLVAVGIAVLLTALLSAAGAATGLTEVSDSEAETVGIVSGALLLAVLAIAYYAGGYVAGRLARFDGARQGLGVWVIALALTVIVAVAGALLGAEYNIFSRLDLPRIPIEEGDLTTGGVIALVAAVVVTLVAAISGGKVGERFHRKVDRAGGRY